MAADTLRFAEEQRDQEHKPGPDKDLNAACNPVKDGGDTAGQAAAKVGVSVSSRPTRKYPGVLARSVPRP